MKAEPYQIRFWRKVEKTDGCWWWTGCKIPKGYGQLWVDAKMVNAHRVSYQMHHGEIPEGMVVMHSCDQPACVNPDHLSVGTHKDNHHDSIRKGRHTFQLMRKRRGGQQ